MIKDISSSTYDYQIEALTIMIYGPPGSGKTYFMGTMPKPYIISLDKGLKGLRLQGKQFDGCEVDTLDDLSKVIDEILAGTRAKGAGSFGLDHLTEVTELGILKTDLRNKPGTHKRAVWGDIADHVRVTTRKFLDIAKVRNVPVCVAAHQQIEKNEIIGAVIGSPDTVGKFALSCGGLFDIFLYSRQELEWDAGKQVPKWNVSTVDYLHFPAKDRTGTLGVTEPNDFNTIMSKIKARVEQLKEIGNA